MENSIKNTVVEALKQKMSATNLSANKASTIIGFSGATLSNMLNGKWSNISEDLWRLAQAWTGYRIGWKLSVTSNVKRVHNICRDAQKNKKSIGIADEAGCGKTAALRWYANANVNVAYVYWTKKVLLAKILQAMGEESYGSVPEMVDKIVQRLNEMDSPLLILDEFDKLKESAMQLFKTLYNKTEDNAGFVVAGTPYLRERITKGCNKDKQAYKEIRSRLGGSLLAVQTLKNEVFQQDIIKMATDNGIAEKDMSRLLNDIGKSKDLRVIRRMIETYLLENSVKKVA
jgi:DNA transposition AAA+ family ATPase